jgi:hypothetical protein
VNDRDGVMLLVLFELADAADGYLFGALAVEAETREGFLCVRLDGARRVLES